MSAGQFIAHDTKVYVSTETEEMLMGPVAMNETVFGYNDWYDYQKLKISRTGRTLHKTAVKKRFNYEIHLAGPYRPTTAGEILSNA